MDIDNPKKVGGARAGAGRKPGAVNKATAKARQLAESTGITPLEFMLAVMRDETADRAERLDMAKAAAPYVHAKLTATTIDATLANPDGSPLGVHVKFRASDAGD